MRFLSFAIIGLIPATVLALSYDAVLPYSDAPPDHRTAVAVGALTEEGILEGNPDGTFRYMRLLNRAEFMKIAMKLVPRVYPVPLWEAPFSRSCFPDVASDAWFAEPICHAKALDIVHGNAIEGVDPKFWFFEPSRPVQYEEALKVLINIFEIPIPVYRCTGRCLPREWYEPYLDAAQMCGLDLPFSPGHKLTRGQVSRLVARFIAYDQGELDQLLRAEDGEVPGGVGEGSTSSVSSSSSSSAATWGGGEDGTDATYDPDTDVSTKSRFLMLGETSPVLGSAEVFSDTEPLDVTKVTVIFTSASSLNSIEALHVYDEIGEYLGRANRDTSAGSRHYVLNMKNGSWVVPKRESRYFYVRAVVSGYRSGGVSGDAVEVDTMQVEGDGVWSNRSYTKGTSEDFNAFQTARSVVTDISNGGDATGLLVSGTGIPLGSYRFEGETGDGTAELRVTDLTFNIEVNDSVTVSNVELGSEGSSDRHSCTVGASTVTCSSIPAIFGSFKGAARVLTLYGDVTVPTDVRSPRLSLTLNQPGSVGSTGSVTWTDGDTSFSWVPFGTPVARGTIYSY